MSNDVSKQFGFTLIELMIVMVLMALAMSFVGPLAINSMEKSQSKVESRKLKNLLDKIGIQALLRSEVITVRVSGKQGKVLNSDNEVMKELKFDYLFFNNQTVTFSKFGFSSQSGLEGSARGLKIHIPLEYKPYGL